MRTKEAIRRVESEIRTWEMESELGVHAFPSAEIFPPKDRGVVNDARIAVRAAKNATRSLRWFAVGVALSAVLLFWDGIGWFVASATGAWRAPTPGGGALVAIAWFLAIVITITLGALLPFWALGWRDHVRFLRRFKEHPSIDRIEEWM